MKVILKISICLCLLASFSLANAQNYMTQTAKISFYSYTPVEDIKAEAKDATAIISTKTNKVAFSVRIRSFQFPKKLMQEHFNEKYMESDKKGYEIASFIGAIVEKVDLNADGTYKVNVKGKLKVHNVEQERTIPGVVVVKNGKMTVTSDFKVKVADHKIQIPTIVTANIAEVIDVKVNAELVKK